MKKLIIGLVICLIILMIWCGILIFKKNGWNIPIVNTTDPSIVFFAERLDGANEKVNQALGVGVRSVIEKNAKYKITNQEELELFFMLYGCEILEEYDLSKETIFIETMTYSTGSVGVNFKGVKIKENVEFNVKIKSPKGPVTNDMADWFLCAIIPNTKLDGINVDEWKSPIDVNNSLKSEERIIKNEIIISNTANLSFSDSLNIVEKAVNDIGHIIIQEYNYSNINFTNYYKLISYYEKSALQLRQKINNLENGMKASFNRKNTKDESEYNESQNSLNKTKTPHYSICIRRRFFHSKS